MVILWLIHFKAISAIHYYKNTFSLNPSQRYISSNNRLNVIKGTMYVQCTYINLQEGKSKL